MIEAVVQRLDARVPQLRGRVKGAADFARLMASNTFRDAQGGAYVLPMSLRGGAPQAATGAFVQPLDETLTVVLVRPSVDPRGPREPGELSQLIESVMEALAGFRPPHVPGPLRVTQGRMLNVGAGVLVYQLDFAVTRHLRISPT
ncbi:Gp37 family protein [Halodurantibacterium flavum]|uniref:Gp37 family protein n=1 Tax=Halodurantibacterium flavum TaxID=1382802 RepID=A0ABW4S939_9RHOB